MPNAREPQFATWNTPQCPFLIECDLQTLEETGREVMEGIRAAGGAVEVGGLLLGTFDGERLRILGFEPIPCEHAFGPAFILSESDQHALGERLRAHERESNASGHAVLGWYHSHAPGAPVPPDDIALHDRFFPEPWQIILFRTDSNRNDRVGFLCRAQAVEDVEHRAPVREPAPTAIRNLGPFRAPPFPFEEPRAAVREPEPRQPELAVDGSGVGQSLIRPVVPPRPPEGELALPPPWIPAPIPPKRRMHQNRIVWAVLGGMFAVCMGTIVYLGLNVPEDAPRNSTSRAVLHMDAANRNGILELTWDRAPIGDAQEGRLEIDNGTAREQLTLDRKTLVSGRLPYGHTADLARFRLVVQQPGGATIEGSTTFVAPGASIRPALVPEPPKPAELLTTRAAVTPLPPKTPERPAPTAIAQAAGKKEPDVRQPATPKNAAPQPVGTAAKAAAISQPTPRTEAARPSESSAAKPETLAVPEPIQIAQAPSQAIPERPLPVAGPPLASPSQAPAAQPSPALPSLRVTAPPPAPTIAQPPQFRLAGHWLLQSGGYSRSPAVPESVSISVTDINGGVQGTLDARYRSRSKTERIHFSFSGKIVNGSARCSWTSTDGRRGEIELIRVPNSADMLEVVWRGPEPKQVFNEMVKRSN